MMNLIYKLSDFLKWHIFKMKHKVTTEARENRLMALFNCRLFVDRTATLDLNGSVLFNENIMGNTGRTTILRMGKESRMIVNGLFRFYYGADIQIFDGGTLVLRGDSFINSECKIRCKEKIVIGKNCAISHNVTIMDTDGHSIEKKKNVMAVNIGDHVWIGHGVTICKGVNVGDGAVIASGSVVIRDVESNSLVAGVPATVVRKDICWE